MPNARPSPSNAASAPRQEAATQCKVATAALTPSDAEAQAVAVKSSPRRPIWAASSTAADQVARRAFSRCHGCAAPPRVATSRVRVQRVWGDRGAALYSHPLTVLIAASPRLGWNWLRMLLVATLALGIRRGKHSRWGPCWFANKGALLHIQSASALRRNSPRPQGSAPGIPPMRMALLVLLTFTATVSGSHERSGLVRSSPPPPPLSLRALATSRRRRLTHLCNNPDSCSYCEGNYCANYGGTSNCYCKCGMNSYCSRQHRHLMHGGAPPEAPRPKPPPPPVPSPPPPLPWGHHSPRFQCSAACCWYMSVVLHYRVSGTAKPLCNVCRCACSCFVYTLRLSCASVVSTAGHHLPTVD